MAHHSLAQVVFSSCELGVFDLLLGAERPLSAEEISQAVGTSVDGTERLLAACAGLQLLNIHQDNGRCRQPHTTGLYTIQIAPSGQIKCFWIELKLSYSCLFVISHSPPAPHFSVVLCSSRSGLYSNTEQASVYLTRSSPVSLSQSIQYSSRTIYLCWHYLTDAVKSVRSGLPPISW